MAVKLRLKRMGAKQKPFYRIVAADSRSPRDGRFIETVGTYNPVANPAEVKIDKELALKWLGMAQNLQILLKPCLEKKALLKSLLHQRPKKVINYECCRIYRLFSKIFS